MNNVLAIIVGVWLAITAPIALLIGRVIRKANQAAAPTPAELINLGAVALDDEQIEAIRAGRPALDDDPTLTRMFAAWRDDLDDDSAWRPATWDAREVLNARDRDRGGT